LWLHREVTANYDDDEQEVSIINKEKATELLQAWIKERDRRIKDLEDQNKEAKNELSELK